MSDQPDRQDEDRVSLAPLEPEDALRALLAVDPDTQPVDGDQAEDDGD